MLERRDGVGRTFSDLRMGCSSFLGVFPIAASKCLPLSLELSRAEYLETAKKDLQGD